MVIKRLGMTSAVPKIDGRCKVGLPSRDLLIGSNPDAPMSRSVPLDDFPRTGCIRSMNVAMRPQGKVNR